MRRTPLIMQKEDSQMVISTEVKTARKITFRFGKPETFFSTLMAVLEVANKAGLNGVKLLEARFWDEPWHRHEHVLELYFGEAEELIK